jgi:hypothetical protein
MGRHTTRTNSSNCSEPLIKLMEVKLLLNSNNSHPAVKRMRGAKYFMVFQIVLTVTDNLT